MKTEQHSKIVLSDNETLLLLEGFCYEALQFLKVPVKQYPIIRIGVSMEADGRANPLFIDYTKSKVLIFIPIIRMLLTSVMNNDAPTLFRIMGYQIARFWERFTLTGKQEPFNSEDKDSFIFASLNPVMYLFHLSN